MIKLITECNNFINGFGYPYAFCGGYALELFLNKKLRPHSDIDVSVFEENKVDIVEFMLRKGWNVYEHKADWIDNKIANSYLRLLLNPNDNRIAELNSVWVIKPGSTLFKLHLKPNEETIYDYEILNGEQLNFDFIEVIFNKQKDGNFIIDSFTSQGKNILRELEKAILYNNEGIPFIAPEVKLFIISHPAYLKSEYHKTKNLIDFESTIPFLPKENKEWLIYALETAYPDGHIRIEQIKNI